MFCKTFNYYVSFPKSRWPEIKLAEKNDPEGKRMFEELKEEFTEKYLYKNGSDKLFNDVHHELPLGMGKMS